MWKTACRKPRIRFLPKPHKHEDALAIPRTCGEAHARAHGRPDRIALLHMRSLQTVDGLDAGATQREIAQALFGAAVVAERWHDLGELRAQVRRLARRGRALVDGGYRCLLQIEGAGDGRSG